MKYRDYDIELNEVASGHWVYFLAVQDKEHIKYGTLIKIGLTCNFKLRMKAHKKRFLDYILLGVIPGYCNAEKITHQKFWMTRLDASELFIPSAILTLWIRKWVQPKDYFAGWSMEKRLSYTKNSLFETPSYTPLICPYCGIKHIHYFYELQDFEVYQNNFCSSNCAYKYEKEKGHVDLCPFGVNAVTASR